ncbi:ADP-ribosylglycohydrolase family protein [Streptomyces sp. NPDC018036]|uniref:ADP-ribosylglycohydrolase family protein n=1 Tax=Streptomyces sp. NPDC018036 TaxID=3365035 RepID=UPI00378EE65C
MRPGPTPGADTASPPPEKQPAAPAPHTTKPGPPALGPGPGSLSTTPEPPRAGTEPVAPLAPTAGADPAAPAAGARAQPTAPAREAQPVPPTALATAAAPPETPRAGAEPVAPVAGTGVQPVVLLGGGVRAVAFLGGGGPGVGSRIVERPAAPATGAEPVPGGTAGARRVEGLLLGLAAGDAAGWPAARHRAARMPEWTRRLTRELDTFAEQNATTTLPVPIALNQPPEPLRLGPSDDAEWAAFAAEAVLRAGDTAALGDLSLDRRMRASIDVSWNAVASEVAAAADRAPEVESALLPLRARISVRAGLGNLATGLRPPATGHDNPHYFDDAACVRACVLAVAHPGDSRLAAELAEFDARYTQDGDGVHGARAMAAAVALALAGHDVATCVEAALAELPAATEIGRNARHALALARDSDSTFALVPLLEHQIVDHVYSYGIAAAETVPVALALALAARGRIAEAVPAAACLSRVADSAPALAGALTGALGGAATIPASWRDACRTLSGCALPRLTGTDLVGLAELLEATGRADPLRSPELSAPEG